MFKNAQLGGPETVRPEQVAWPHIADVVKRVKAALEGADATSRPDGFATIT
jgi:hypothetical protein